MELKETVQDEFVLVAVSGDIDHASAGILEDRLFFHFTADIRKVVIDLKDCNFIDSSGLAVLLVHLNRMQADALLAVVAPNPNIRRLFDLVALSERPGFESHENLFSAVASVSARS